MEIQEENFNSRPHEEVDRHFEESEKGKKRLQLTTSRGGRRIWDRPPPIGIPISTHDLTRRSTQHFVNLLPGLCISTHDLTRRSTNLNLDWLLDTVFQLTTSRGGRHLFLCAVIYGVYISTHDLTRRSTLYTSSYYHLLT